MDANLETTQLERRVVTVNEAAVMLRISRSSAYEAVRRKEIPTIRIGRRLLVPLVALERLLAASVAA
jgi:excisionase family DNA binding protein